MISNIEAKNLLNKLTVYQLKDILRAHNHHYYEKVKVPKNILVDEVFKFYTITKSGRNLLKKRDDWRPAIQSHVKQVRKPKGDKQEKPKRTTREIKQTMLTRLAPKLKEHLKKQRFDEARREAMEIAREKAAKKQRQQLLLQPPLEQEQLLLQEPQLLQEPIIFEPRRNRPEGATTDIRQLVNEYEQLRGKLKRMHLVNRISQKGEKMRQKIKMLGDQIQFLSTQVEPKTFPIFDPRRKRPELSSIRL
jgi:hypothetical protein